MMVQRRLFNLFMEPCGTLWNVLELHEISFLDTSDRLQANCEIGDGRCVVMENQWYDKE